MKFHGTSFSVWQILFHLSIGSGFFLVVFRLFLIKPLPPHCCVCTDLSTPWAMCVCEMAVDDTETLTIYSYLVHKMYMYTKPYVVTGIGFAQVKWKFARCLRREHRLQHMNSTPCIVLVQRIAAYRVDILCVCSIFLLACTSFKWCDDIALILHVTKRFCPIRLRLVFLLLSSSFIF